VSHELRTPLSSVMLQVSTLLKYYDRFEESERHDMIQEVQQQAQVLRDLIEDILELSRFDAKRAMPQKRWFDLAEQCRGVVTSMRHATDEKLLAVDMRGCADQCYLLADPHQLERVVRNLFSNAVKYTPVSGSVALRLAQVGNEVKLEVQDSGIGIAPEEQAHVFDRFFRSNSVSHMASGTGLGLSIIKEILDLHRGRIELRSTLGEGSIFAVTLPVGSPEDERLAKENTP
jgi:signal transduction histidine kinase